MISDIILVKYNARLHKITIDYNNQFVSSDNSLSGEVVKHNKLIISLLINGHYETFVHKKLHNIYEHVPYCKYDGKRVINIFTGGGLGNQLFHYAFAQYVNSKCPNSTVCFNTVWFRQPECDREYHLEKFKLNDNVKISDTLQNYITLNNVVYESRIESEYGNLDNVLSNQDDVSLSGYWQRWEYIKDNLDMLRDCFTLKDSIEDETFLLYKDKITSAKQSCSIHIRRTDYLNNKNIYSILDIDYYVKGIEYLKHLYNDDIEFFCFSDDIEWCKLAFKNFKNIHFIENAKCDIHDFELMQLCNNNIIANSTFSWWAALLNRNTDKRVIAPKAWYMFEHNLFQFGCDGRCILT